MIREGRARGWRPGLAYFALSDRVAAESFPYAFEAAMKFMGSIQSRRDRRRRRRLKEGGDDRSPDQV